MHYDNHRIDGTWLNGHAVLFHWYATLRKSEVFFKSNSCLRMRGSLHIGNYHIVIAAHVWRVGDSCPRCEHCGSPIVHMATWTTSPIDHGINRLPLSGEITVSPLKRWARGLKKLQISFMIIILSMRVIHFHKVWVTGFLLFSLSSLFCVYFLFVLIPLYHFYL